MLETAFPGLRISREIKIFREYKEGQDDPEAIAAAHPYRHAITTETRDCISLDQLKHYKARRWLWKDLTRSQDRRIEANLHGLLEFVRSFTASSYCASVTKLPEGHHSQNLAFRMVEGREVVVNIPVVSNNGRSEYYTNASEAATMEYVSTYLGIPAPRVLNRCSHSALSTIGTEYIIMDKPHGKEICLQWEAIDQEGKESIARQLATLAVVLSKKPFKGYGSLYYKQDLRDCERIDIDDRFAIGPTTDPSWYENGRDSLDINRGPWKTTWDYVKALVKREFLCSLYLPPPAQDSHLGIHDGPGCYGSSRAAKCAALMDCLRILEYILPGLPSLHSPILWNHSLDGSNILVNNDTHSPEITCIPSWRGATISPMFLTARFPHWLDPRNLGLDTIFVPEPRRSFEERCDQRPLLATYDAFIQKENPELRWTHHFPWEDIRGQIFEAIGSTYVYGEASLQALLGLLSQKDQWKVILDVNTGKFSSDEECPLQYSENEMKEQRANKTLFDEDVKAKEMHIRAVGCGFDGAVLLEDYDEALVSLHDTEKTFMHRRCTGPDHWPAWKAVWPFKDDKDD